jgi:hypothetical protein
MKRLTNFSQIRGVIWPISVRTLVGAIFAMSGAITHAQDRVSQNCAQLGMKQGAQGQNDCVSRGLNVLLVQNSITPLPATKPKLAPELTVLQLEEKFWDDAKTIGNKEAFEAYLASYPTGRYVSLASASILRLSTTKTSPVQDVGAECLGNPESWNRCIGTKTFADGGKYVGEFKEGKSNGHGTRTWPDGAKYVGEFRDNKRSGQGAFLWPDGSKYVGEFRDGKPNGQGTRTLPDGSINYSGLWADGRRENLRSFERCRAYGFDPKSTSITQCILQLELADQQTARAQSQQRVLEAQAQNQRRELESRCGLAEAQGWLAPSAGGGFAEGAQRAAAAYSACMAGLPPPTSGRVICRREGRDEVNCISQ